MASSSSYRQLISPGTRLNGIYEIDQAIGSGGMGEIYRGHTIQTGDAVAIKVIRPELAEDEAALALFRKEASALHNLHHEAIVRYYVFTIEPVLQRPYLAMEFVEGQALSDLLKQGPLVFEAVCRLLQRVASGLQAAHDRGIVHRDVSPDNIIVPDGDVGRSKIIDFGIARSTKLGDGTVIGSGFAGKYNYVSPEQLGLFGGEVAAKSDVYSLGLVLAEALTGRALDMGGSQAAIIEKRRRLPDLGAIDMRLRPLLERMLQPDPANRPESMAAVLAWPLGSADRTTPPWAGRSFGSASRPDHAPRRSRKWRYALAPAIIVLAAGVGAGAYLLQSSAPLTSAPPPPVLPVGPAAGLGGAAAPQTPPAQQGSAAALPERPPPAGARPPTPPQLPTLAPAQSKPATPPAQSGGSNLALSAPPSAAAPPPATLPSPMGNRAEQIKQYIDTYDGGECFFVWPVAVSDRSAVVEGFGASTKPFGALDSSFQRANGFEASIGVRQVTEAQCPAITFLGRLRSERARAPHIEIESTSVKSGDTLSGTIDRYGDRAIELLLVSDGGSVQNISNLLKDGADGKTFSIGMRRVTGAAGPQPQLLMAVATAERTDALHTSAPVSADKFFANVLGESARSGRALSASVKYFILDK